MPIDDLVEQAMRRWPSVPAVFGWLRLDRRGHWLLIDRGRPDFDETLHGPGSEITSPPILDFLGRNYLGDEQGRWHWQNGPQRVFVDLDLAPLILRVLGEGSGTHLSTHTGFLVEPGSGAWLDEAGAGRFVGARALIHLQAEALLALSEPARAERFLQDQIALYRADPKLWQLLAKAHNGLNQTALAHRATAEEYALGGRWLAAIEQLRLAQRSGTLDFYTGSLVDARTKEFQAEYQREQKEKTR